MAKKSRPAKAAAVTSAETPRMLDHYMKQVRPQLAEALGRSNPHSIPRLEKIVVNMGVGVAVSRDEAREQVYGMPYEQWKTLHQTGPKQPMPPGAS
jgi:hypothetical protein